MIEIKTPFERRLDDMELDIAKIKDIVEQLHIDMLDCKEAFEHNDDSLTNLRIVVNGLTKVLPQEVTI
jgi:hypothetical protein